MTRRTPRPARRTVLAALAAGALAPTTATAGERVRVPDPPPGKGLIVFYRKWTYGGFVYTYMVREGKAEIGPLGAGQYFFAVVEPGLHTYSVRAALGNDMQLVVDPDETYYVLCEITMGYVLYQPTLSPSEQWKFDEISGSLKPSQPGPAAALPRPAP